MQTVVYLQSAFRSVRPDIAYVPISHDARYFFCSRVSLSILTPIALSLSQAIFLSMSSCTKYTFFLSFLLLLSRYSTEIVWLAKLMSITLGDAPAARLRGYQLA